MVENEITGIVINACLRIHKQLGPGLLESIYETVLAYELAKVPLKIQTQQKLPLVYDGITLPNAFRADLIIEGKVVVEVKSAESIAPVHYKQLLTYLRLTDMKVGLLVNFNVELMKHGINRVVNNY